MDDRLEIRPEQPDRDAGLRGAVGELDIAAFKLGHGPMPGQRGIFNNEEIDLLRHHPVPGAEWDFTWRPLLPSVTQNIYAFWEGELIGHLRSYLNGDSRNEYIVIEPINVLPGWQGKRIGRRMWAYVRSLYDGHQRYMPKGVRVWAIERNLGAVHFYRTYCKCEIDASQTGHSFRIDRNTQPAIGLRYDF